MTAPIERTLLDSDVVSALMRSHRIASARAAGYRALYPGYSMSAMTHFEVVRGLRAIRATRQESQFEVFARESMILPLTDEIFERAADIYAVLHRAGRLIPDADLLIASTALVHDMIVATNNEAHFSRVPGLRIDNWLKPV